MQSEERNDGSRCEVSEYVLFMSYERYVKFVKP